MTGSYRNEKINSHITRIIDPAGVACYLIEGEDRACLLDTCCGYGNIRQHVSSLTQSKVVVILTHGHYDHTGGAGFFDEVYMSPEDLSVLALHAAERKKYFEMDKKMIPSLAGFSFEQVHIYRGKPRPLKDGQIFDLGGLHIRMIKVPGHTPGMMCALIEEDRIMFFGDACGMNVLLHEEYASTVSEYLESLQVLKQYEDRYDTVYRNHGTYENKKDLLDNVIECAELIRLGLDDHVPVKMFHWDLFQAKRSDSHGRLDGKYGNIIYAEEKAI